MEERWRSIQRFSAHSLVVRYPAAPRNVVGFCAYLLRIQRDRRSRDFEGTEFSATSWAGTTSIPVSREPMPLMVFLVDGAVHRERSMGHRTRALKLRRRDEGPCQALHQDALSGLGTPIRRDRAIGSGPCLRDTRGGRQECTRAAANHAFLELGWLCVNARGHHRQTWLHTHVGDSPFMYKPAAVSVDGKLLPSSTHVHQTYRVLEVLSVTSTDLSCNLL